MARNVYGIGYIGNGKYSLKENPVQYNYWRKMLERCYSKKSLEKYPTYKDCVVCEEWHNFQNFAKWFDENYYECNDGYVMNLDKDILYKDNKVYSPKTCIFVSQRINALFLKRNAMRGKYPIGVYYTLNKFKAQCKIYNKDKRRYIQKHLGLFNTPEEAFYKYKEFKEQYIKEVANEYKEIIPKKLYEAMYKYVININD